MKQFAKKFYKSKAWQDCREAFFKSKFGLCEQCGAGGVIVHHKIILTPQNINDPSVTMNWDKLELLCLLCHNKAHGSGSTSDGTMFDAAGNLIPKTPPPVNKCEKTPGDRAGEAQRPRQSPIKPRGELHGYTKNQSG
jgi:5-methylcytosine-specific restriction endonuclease McrA